MKLSSEQTRLLLRIEEEGRSTPNNRVRIGIQEEHPDMDFLVQNGLIRASWGSSTLREITDLHYASLTDRGKQLCKLIVSFMPMVGKDQKLMTVSLPLA